MFLLKTILILIGIAMAKEKPMEKRFVHVHGATPFFLFHVDTVKNWNIQKFSETTLRFNPGDSVHIRFEIPPAINVIYPSRIKDHDIVIRAKEEGRNPNGVEFKAVFLKGWETNAYQMKVGSDIVYVNDGIGDHSKLGLSGDKVLKQVRDSFLFLNTNDLREAELLLIIEGSRYGKMISDMKAIAKVPITLSIDKQVDKYVVVPQGFRGGPVFHILRKDLSVMHVNEK